MMNLAEYRRTVTRLADFLPWAALVGEGVMLNKDGSLQRSARFRGPDLESSVPAELIAVAGRLNNAFRRLGSGWAIFVEAQRHAVGAYSASRFPDAASALVDAERKADFEEDSAHFESSYFLTFVYLPPAEDAARAEAWLYEGKGDKGVDAWEVLRGFVDRTDRILQLIETFMPECRWLDDGETLTYLHSCVSTKRHRVRVPEIPMHLDAVARRSAADRRAGTTSRRRASSRSHNCRLSDRNDTRLARRIEPACLSVSLVDARDTARQNRRDPVADQNPPAVVFQAQEHRRHPQGGDDQRSVCPGRHRRGQQSERRRSRAPGTWRRLRRSSLCDRDRHGLGRRSAHRRRKAPIGREDHPGPRLHGDAGVDQRRRCVARLAAGPCLRQCAAAPH